MFTDAIISAAQYTRPVHLIYRKFESKSVLVKPSTIIFVNEMGCAISTWTTFLNLLNSDQIAEQYNKYKKEREALSTSKKSLDEQYNYSEDSIVEQRGRLVNCFDAFSDYKVIQHPIYNLAIIQFNNMRGLKYNDFAKFIKGDSDFKVGKSLCIAGYPFNEKDIYLYDDQIDQINLKNQNEDIFNIFQVEGVITKLLEHDNKYIGMEICNPGLEGHEGAPLLDANGLINGIHVTNKLIPKDNMVENHNPKIISECLNSQVITEFLNLNGVKYYEIDKGKLVVNNDNYLGGVILPDFNIADWDPIIQISGTGESEMIVYSSRVEVNDDIVFDSNIPMKLTTGKVDSGSIKPGTSTIKLPKEQGKAILINEEGTGRTNLLDEQKGYCIGVKQRKSKSDNWKAEVKVKTQGREPFEYFDLVLIRRNGQARNHIKDPHVAFYPDGSGKFIRYDNEKDIKVLTTKILDSVNKYILPQETSIQSEAFEVKMTYEFKDETLFIISIEVVDK